jgi:hypothetical protein
MAELCIFSAQQEIEKGGRGEEKGGRGRGKHLV